MATLTEDGQTFEVLPCPFCGEDPTHIAYHSSPCLADSGTVLEARSVFCASGLKCIQHGPIRSSAEAAVKAWNQRG